MCHTGGASLKYKYNYKLSLLLGHIPLYMQHGPITIYWPLIYVHEGMNFRASTLADQYRKKSTLYKTNVLLVPLGDDFRWDTEKEIKNQFQNYFKLMEYMNGHPEMKMKVSANSLDGRRSGIIQGAVYL